MRDVPSKFAYGLAEAAVAATRSKDPSTQVGAAIFDRSGRIISKGYNGFPEGIEETAEMWTRENKGDWVIHAEVNAIANAARVGVSTLGARIFLTIPPCHECAKVVVAAGISELFYPAAAAKDWFARSPHWKESLEKSLRFLETCNVRTFSL